MGVDDTLVQCFPGQDPVVVERQELEHLAGHVVGEVVSATVVCGVAAPQALQNLRAEAPEVALVHQTEVRSRSIAAVRPGRAARD